MADIKRWPFPILKDSEESTAEDRSAINFLETAFQEGYESYCVNCGSLYGADNSQGRRGEIIRRGGNGRYWEVVLDENDKKVQSKFIDGFDAAATAVLLWLRGSDSTTAFEHIALAIVARPGERG